MMRSPRPIIIISHTARDDEVSLSLEATRAGALVVLPKPDGPLSPRFAGDRKQIISMVRAMAAVKVVRRHGSATPAASVSRPSTASTPRPADTQARGPVRLVAIAASTGGPAAIQTILAGLPRDFPVPILVVQHIALGFSRGLAHWLDQDAPLRVKLAELNEEARAGTAYIAPDDFHIGCRVDSSGTLRIVLDGTSARGAFRPSASYMFQSVADSLGAGSQCVILTGMGDDGIVGLRAVKSAGGRVIAQDEASSVIFGMPREAIRAGVVDAVLPLSQIARRITEAVS